LGDFGEKAGKVKTKEEIFRMSSPAARKGREGGRESAAGCERRESQQQSKDSRRGPIAAWKRKRVK